MALETFPEFAVNLIYTILCLVPGFLTLKTATYLGGIERDLDKFEKSTWSLLASGIALSVLYYVYVVWTVITTGRFVLATGLDLQWTELVAAYPLILAVAVALGYFSAHLIMRIRGAAATSFAGVGQNQSTE